MQRSSMPLIMFQLVVRKDPIWSYFSSIFDKWENCEIKGQKVKEVKKPKSKEASVDARAHFEDMKLTEWKLMQPLKNSEVVIPVLQRVLDKELSLQRWAKSSSDSSLWELCK